MPPGRAGKRPKIGLSVCEQGKGGEHKSRCSNDVAHESSHLMLDGKERSVVVFT